MFLQPKHFSLVPPNMLETLAALGFCKAIHCQVMGGVWYSSLRRTRIQFWQNYLTISRFIRFYNFRCPWKEYSNGVNYFWLKKEKETDSGFYFSLLAFLTLKTFVQTASSLEELIEMWPAIEYSFKGIVVAKLHSKPLVNRIAELHVKSTLNYPSLHLTSYKSENKTSS